ncbi:MAG: hypothetical protein JW787_14290 [Sedimentisphaerales bacterium]|nr:hypothetical protein [Sedimentisphaerales bacterium]
MAKNLKASAGIWIIGIILLIMLSTLFYMNIHRTRNGHSFGDPLTPKQKAQRNSIDAALELFSSEFDSLPPSDRLDPNGIPYCGAMKLAEAMVGQDLMGFHPNSIFRNDGKDPTGKLLYDAGLPNFNPALRKGPYLPIENANIYRLKDIFENTGPFDRNEYVICDIFIQKRRSGKKTGMPLLYFKADTTKSSHDVNNPDNPDNIYNYKDNYDLLALGMPGKPGVKHPLYEDPSLFYIMTQNYNDTSKSTPFNKDSYILISAGKDGLYGTSDDIANFDFRWRPK